ncbi:MAG: hypothetical protein WCK89_16030 [bacterium]
MNLNIILAALAVRRPIFHSEFDFQHELAWQIHNSFRDSGIRLEFPIAVADRRMEIDIWVTHEARRIAVELKYKTRAANVNHFGEQFNLAQHAATPLARYDTWRDVERLECLRTAGLADEAWAIFLTNDSGYWSNRPARGNGAEFSLHEGRMVTHGNSPLVWQDPRNIDSIGAARVPGIAISNTYNLRWVGYSAAPLHLRFLALNF